MKKLSLLDVKLNTLDSRRQLIHISRRLKQNKQTVIFTPNPQILLRAQSDKSFKNTLNSSDINIPDGIGCVIASRILRSPISHRISGIDFAESLLRICEKEGYSVFLIGGKEGIASAAANNLKERFPRLCVSGTHHGYFNKCGKENAQVVQEINKAAPDILFVCFGAPKQENWISKNISSLPSVKLAMGLGGSLDVWAGNVKRAPLLWQRSGCEWLWRSLREPRRLRILFDIPLFIFAVKMQKRRARRCKLI